MSMELSINNEVSRYARLSRRIPASMIGDFVDMHRQMVLEIVGGESRGTPAICLTQPDLRLLVYRTGGIVGAIFNLNDTPSDYECVLGATIRRIVAK